MVKPGVLSNVVVSVCRAALELRENLVSLPCDAFERPQLGLMGVARLRISPLPLFALRLLARLEGTQGVTAVTTVECGVAHVSGATGSFMFLALQSLFHDNSTPC